MKVVHVAESFSAGIIDFISHICNETSSIEHTIIYGEREIKERNANIEDIKKRFNALIPFVKWNYAQREINIFKDLKAAYELFKLLKQTEYDIIHLHSSKAGFIGRMLTIFLKRKKIIYTPHSAYFLRTDIHSLKKRMIIFLEKMASKTGGVIVCCSASECKAFLDKNINATFINNGITITNPPIHILHNKFVVVTSGRISEQKNPAMFNEIASYFVNQPHIEFLWIGDGYLKNHLTSPNITISGWLDKTGIYNYLSKSDLFLSTSLWEGLSYSALEAMTYEKALLLHNCVGNIDMVINDYNGYLFTTTEEAIQKIEYLLKNQHILGGLGKNSRTMCVENFDIKKSASSYSQLYYALTK